MLEKMFILPVLCVGYAISTDCLVFPFGLYFFFFLVSDCRVVVRFYMDVGWMSEIKIDSLIHWLIEQTQPQLQISDIIIIQTTVVSRPTITPHAGLCLPIALVNGPTTAESRVYTGPHSLHAVVYVAYASEFTPPMPQSLRRLRLRAHPAGPPSRWWCSSANRPPAVTPSPSHTPEPSAPPAGRAAAPAPSGGHRSKPPSPDTTRTPTIIIIIIIINQKTREGKNKLFSTNSACNKCNKIKTPEISIAY